ncbi:MAG TPA: hypothetical protein VHV77_15025, partial [Pirellulales bacterium]|nr:hypothetical protein [Pirellulales bacterium]
LYVGCVHGDSVFVIGSGNLRSYSLANGRIEWDAALAGGSTPSGRGFFNGEHYFLPLSSAEVVAVDLDDGSVVATAKSRTGTVPGNLICHDGAVVSQSGAWLESFFQLDELQNYVRQTLAAKPDDAEALELKAELALNDGHLDDALDLLRKSYAAHDDPRTRQLLIESLLEGLRTDFARYRPQSEELERLIELPAQQLTYLRELAAGQQRSGETLAAFGTCLKIVDLPSVGSDELERVDASLWVRRDRWVQARLELLRDRADADELTQMDRQLRERLKDSVAEENVEALRSFVDYFGSLPVADEARAILAERSAGLISPLELEQLLRRMAESDDAPLARSAVARLARLLKQNDRLYEAGPFIKQLEDWRDDVCLDGMTGRQVLDELLKDQLAAEAILAPSWPTGVVEREPLKTQPNTQSRVYAIDMRGPRGPFFDNATIELDQQQQSIAGRDGLGHERWRVSLADRNDQGNPYPLNFSLSHARADGHLLVASLGFQLVAIDTLGGSDTLSSGKGGARVLWRKDLTDVLPNTPRQIGNQPRVVQMPWGVPRFLANDAFGHPVGTTGAVNSEFVCFQRQRNLIAVHPITGKTLWTRAGVQPGSDIFGDGKLIFVTPPNSTQAVVIGSTDGQMLGHRSVPALEQRLVTLGRRVVTWQTIHGRSVLKLRDPWEEKDVWEKKFDVGAKPWPVEDQAIAVLQLDGRFAIIDAQDGTPAIEAKLKPESALKEIFVFRTPERYLLITNRPETNRDGENVQPIPGSGFSNPLIHGNVYGFDRNSGDLIFTTPVDGRSLTFHQPAELPVLMFAAQVYKQRSNREKAPEVAILCIDKRTGRVAYESRETGPVNLVELIGDAQRHEVIVRTNRGAVRLTFTDEPWPPQVNKEEEPGSLPSRAGRAISRGIQNWLDESILPLGNPFEQ